MGYVMRPFQPDDTCIRVFYLPKRSGALVSVSLYATQRVCLKSKIIHTKLRYIKNTQNKYCCVAVYSSFLNICTIHMRIGDNHES